MGRWIGAPSVCCYITKFILCTLLSAHERWLMGFNFSPFTPFFYYNLSTLRAVCARLWCLFQLLLFTSKFPRSQCVAPCGWLYSLLLAAFFSIAFQFTISHPSPGEHTQTSTEKKKIFSSGIRARSSNR